MHMVKKAHANKYDKRVRYSRGKNLPGECPQIDFRHSWRINKVSKYIFGRSIRPSFREKQSHFVSHVFFNFNFKLYLFYNNNTRLQIGHAVILLGGESIRNILVRENHWNVFSE